MANAGHGQAGMGDDPTIVAVASTKAGRPETVRVRMTVDLVGSIAEELEKTAQQLGKSKTDVIREGLGYVFRALKARDDGYFVGAWKEEPDGKVSRAREFVVGN